MSQKLILPLAHFRLLEWLSSTAKGCYSKTDAGACNRTLRGYMMTISERIKGRDRRSLIQPLTELAAYVEHYLATWVWLKVSGVSPM